MTKKDEDNPDYISIILCSKGLGANYAKRNQLKHRWNKEKTTKLYARVNNSIIQKIESPLEQILKEKALLGLNHQQLLTA